MGARGSKTKPNADAPLSRRGTQTLIVAMDQTNEYEDEVRAPEKIDERSAEPGGGEDSTAKVSKVQEILEGKVELKKNHQPLAQLPKLSLHAATLDLQFSSSEDSDESKGRKRRRGAKKKHKKSKGSTGDTVTTTKPAAPVPSPVKLKLNELNTPKKLSSATQPAGSAPVKKEYFEQISDAYSLTDYAGKEPEDGSPKRQAQLQRQQPVPEEPQQPQPPAKPQPQPSPSSSPSKYFGGAFDNWRKPTISIRSNRSQVMESRDPSRRSPPSNGNSSFKSNSSRAGDRSANSRHFTTNQPGDDYLHSTDVWQSDIDEMERESTSLADSFSSMTTRSRPIETNAATSPITTTTASSPPGTRPKSNRRNLSIDDLDESIMDNILAEVVS